MGGTGRRIKVCGLTQTKMQKTPFKRKKKVNWFFFFFWVTVVSCLLGRHSFCLNHSTSLWIDGISTLACLQIILLRKTSRKLVLPFSHNCPREEFNHNSIRRGIWVLGFGSVGLWEGADLSISKGEGKEPISRAGKTALRRNVASRNRFMAERFSTTALQPTAQE
jgi:hypothetical protein